MALTRFLLDTNVLSEPCRLEPNRHLLARLERYKGELATSSTVWHELVFGARRLPPGSRRNRIAAYLEGLRAALEVLPYDESSAEWHAEERARLAAAGAPPAFADGQIAAVAAARGLTLVTRNVKDFACFSGLAVVDWFAE